MSFHRPYHRPSNAFQRLPSRVCFTPPIPPVALVGANARWKRAALTNTIEAKLRGRTNG